MEKIIVNEKRRLRKIQLNTILKSYEVDNYDNDNNDDYDVYDTYIHEHDIEKVIKLNISPDLEMKLRLYLTKTKENK